VIGFLCGTGVSYGIHHQLPVSPNINSATSACKSTKSTSYTLHLTGYTYSILTATASFTTTMQSTGTSDRGSPLAITWDETLHRGRGRCRKPNSIDYLVLLHLHTLVTIDIIISTA